MIYQLWTININCDAWFHTWIWKTVCYFFYIYKLEILLAICIFIYFVCCRRYFGHKPTIRPNGKKLNPLFMNKTNMTWEDFASRVRTFQIGFMGEPNELRPGSGEFHENPTSCICQNSGSEVKTGGFSNPQNQTHEGNKIEENRTEKKPTEEEREWSELDYDLDSRKQVQLKGTKIDSIPLLMGNEQAEVQEFFSD